MENITATISTEKWYMDYIRTITDKLQDTVYRGEITNKEAMDVAVDTIMATMRHVITVKQGGNDGH